MPLFNPLPTALPSTFLPALLELLPNGVVYYTPDYDAAGTVTDFHFAYLNPSAQRMLGLPAAPTASYLEV
jgi:PAS domain-containing protein